MPSVAGFFPSRSNHHMVAESSMSAEKTQIAPTVFVAMCPATA